ncbi:MAG: hypothetical protein AVDCRST_MAG17-1193, partial [uncultured Solirubrobacterales bacterium]
GSVRRARWRRTPGSLARARDRSAQLSRDCRGGGHRR